MTNTNAERGNELLIQGGKSYPQALAALSEFGRLVLETCRTAFDEELANISRAMGVRISRNDLRNRRRPDRLERLSTPHGGDASLGIRIWRDSEGWRQYCHLVWWTDNTADNVGASASIWFKDTSLAIIACNALKGVPPTTSYLVDREENEVRLLRRIAPPDMAQLPTIFRELNREWARLWRAAGGLKQIQATQRGTKSVKK